MSAGDVEPLINPRPQSADDLDIVLAAAVGNGFMTELRPGTSPPPVRMPIRFFAMTTPLLHSDPTKDRSGSILSPAAYGPKLRVMRPLLPQMMGPDAGPFSDGS